MVELGHIDIATKISLFLLILLTPVKATSRLPST
jgi:hypothetical protein